MAVAASRLRIPYLLQMNGARRVNWRVEQLGYFIVFNPFPGFIFSKIVYLQPKESLPLVVETKGDRSRSVLPLGNMSRAKTTAPTIDDTGSPVADIAAIKTAIVAAIRSQIIEALLHRSRHRQPISCERRPKRADIRAATRQQQSIPANALSGSPA
jgi:hypothetical protein